MMERQRIGASMVAISLREMSGRLTQTRRPLESSMAFGFCGAPCSFASLRSPFGQPLASYLPSVGSTEREGYFALLQ